MPSLNNTLISNTIHQANGRAIPDFEWHNSCGMEKSLKLWMVSESCFLLAAENPLDLWMVLLVLKSMF